MLWDQNDINPLIRFSQDSPGIHSSGFPVQGCWRQVRLHRIKHPMSTEWIKPLRKLQPGIYRYTNKHILKTNIYAQHCSFYDRGSPWGKVTLSQTKDNWRPDEKQWKVNDDKACLLFLLQNILFSYIIFPVLIHFFSFLKKSFLK